MKITTCLLVLINQSRTESYEFVSSLSAHDSSQREIQKTGISYMITMGWTHLLILSCVTQLPSIWCSCYEYWHSLAVISGYTLIFVRPNVVKDDLRRKIIELLLHLHIVLHLQWNRQKKEQKINHKSQNIIKLEFH